MVTNSETPVSASLSSITYKRLLAIVRISSLPSVECGPDGASGGVTKLCRARPSGGQQPRDLAGAHEGKADLIPTLRAGSLHGIPCAPAHQIKEAVETVPNNGRAGQ